MASRCPSAAPESRDAAPEIAVKQELGPVRRPLRLIAEPGDLTLGSAGGRHDIEASAIALGTKRHPAAVRRPCRLPVTGVGERQTRRRHTVNRLNPDIGIAAAIGRICHMAAIR